MEGLVNMSKERYAFLSKNVDAKLTKEELADGWHFCITAWDGMLIHKTWKEFEYCECTLKQVEAENNAIDDILDNVGQLHGEQGSFLESQKKEFENLIQDYMYQCSYSRADAVVAANNVLGTNFQ